MPIIVSDHVNLMSTPQRPEAFQLIRAPQRSHNRQRPPDQYPSVVRRRPHNQGPSEVRRDGRDDHRRDDHSDTIVNFCNIDRALDELESMSLSNSVTFLLST